MIRSVLAHDPQARSPQCPEDLATGYWFSFVLFTAVEVGLFGLLEQSGRDAGEVARYLGFETDAARRFLDALCATDLLARDDQAYFSTKVSSEYLVRGKVNYQGEGILWYFGLLLVE